MSPFTKLTSTFAIASLSVPACRFTEVNPDHCANNDGDAYCAALHADGTRPYCEAGTKGCITPGYERFGCVAEHPQDACYSPCGGPGTLVENGKCIAGSGTTGGTTSAAPTSGTDTNTTATTTADPSSDGTTGPMPCTSDRDCPDAAAPLCVEGTCVQCTPENPVLCDEQLLACDGSTSACIACTEHSQCSSGACELAVGTCFPGDFVVHVDGDGGADYTSVVDAVADVGGSAHGVIVVHALDDGSAYGPVIINDAQIIALLAAPGASPIIQGSLAPTLRVTGEGTVLYMDGLTVSGNAIGLGLRVDAEALAWVDRSRIAENAAGGIVVEGARLVLRNSFVGGVQSTDVLRIQAGTVDVLYSTLGAGTGLSTAISCEMAKHVTVRNSLIVSRDICPEINCPGMILTRSATEIDLQDPVILGFLEIVSVDNVALGDMSPEWFEEYNTGDFHLSGLQPAALDSVAAWSVGDPTIDIDGDARSVDGTLDYAGADIP
jgi:hypothetical protein